MTLERDNEDDVDASVVTSLLRSTDRKKAVPYLVRMLQSIHVLSQGERFHISLRDAAKAAFPDELLAKKDSHKFVYGVFAAMELVGWLICVRRGTSGVQRGGLASYYIWRGPGVSAVVSGVVSGNVQIKIGSEKNEVYINSDRTNS